MSEICMPQNLKYINDKTLWHWELGQGQTNNPNIYVDEMYHLVHLQTEIFNVQELTFS